MSESFGQNLVFDTFVSLSKWLRGVKEAVHVMLDTITAWFLAIAFDFSISAANAGICRSAGNARRRGRRSCSRHDMYTAVVVVMRVESTVTVSSALL